MRILGLVALGAALGGCASSSEDIMPHTAWVKLGSPEVQPGGLLCPRKQTSSDQPVRSGSRRVDIEARAFEEEPCFEDASGQICNRVREAAMWAASLHTLMLPHPPPAPVMGTHPNVEMKRQGSRPSRTHVWASDRS
jgi:hypothetical protein